MKEQKNFQMFADTLKHWGISSTVALALLASTESARAQAADQACTNPMVIEQQNATEETIHLNTYNPRQDILAFHKQHIAVAEGSQASLIDEVQAPCVQILTVDGHIRILNGSTALDHTVFVPYISGETTELGVAAQLETELSDGLVHAGIDTQHVYISGNLVENSFWFVSPAQGVPVTLNELIQSQASVVDGAAKILEQIGGTHTKNDFYDRWLLSSIHDLQLVGQTTAPYYYQRIDTPPYSIQGTQKLLGWQIAVPVKGNETSAADYAMFLSQAAPLATSAVEYPAYVQGPYITHPLRAGLEAWLTLQNLEHLRDVAEQQAEDDSLALHELVYKPSDLDIAQLREVLSGDKGIRIVGSNGLPVLGRGSSDREDWSLVRLAMAYELLKVFPHPSQALAASYLYNPSADADGMLPVSQQPVYLEIADSWKKLVQKGIVPRSEVAHSSGLTYAVVDASSLSDAGRHWIYQVHAHLRQVAGADINYHMTTAPSQSELDIELYVSYTTNSGVQSAKIVDGSTLQVISDEVVNVFIPKDTQVIVELESGERVPYVLIPGQKLEVSISGSAEIHDTVVSGTEKTQFLLSE